MPRGLKLVLAICLAAAGLGCSEHEEKERITILFSNDTRGQIRSCGCPADDLGGLGRRATFVKMVRDTAHQALLLEGGDFFGSGINYGREKAELTVKAMGVMGYDGIVLGEKDLAFGLDFIKKRVEESRLPVLLANLVDSSGDTLIFAAKRILHLPSGRRVLMVGVIGDKLELPAQVKPGSVTVRPPSEGLERLLADARPSDLVIVLAHMELKEATQLARSFPLVDLIVCGHDGRTTRRARRFGNAYLLEIQKEGRFMGMATGTFDEQGGLMMLDFSPVAMSKIFGEDEAVVKLFQAYDMDIAAKEKSSLPTAVTNPQLTVKKPFVGVDKCTECHREIYESWKRTTHASTFEKLVENSRQFDRDCTPCHTTGFYEIGGFVNPERTPRLKEVQCEACHGNGYDHSKKPSVRTPTVPEMTCRVCHDDRQSPDFEFERYWRRIAH